MPRYERTRVFITVLTYPHPSRSHDELVCTAGITESGEWVRLYPVSYRYLPPEKQYKKYQWIDVDLAPHGYKGDKRKESRQPSLSSIVLGEEISPKHRWAERRRVVDRLPVYTRKQLEQLYEKDWTSLGVVRPTRVLDLEIVPTEDDWSPGQEAAMKQLLLFGERKPLKKIPYSFKYVFECGDSTEPHRATITDWEAGVLWLKMAEELGGERAAAVAVRDKFLGELCRDDKDTRFFMGTFYPYNTWLVLGVFWPPKGWQPTLI